jgi:hypothetical protein
MVEVCEELAKKSDFKSKLKMTVVAQMEFESNLKQREVSKVN